MTAKQFARRAALVAVVQCCISCSSGGGGSPDAAAPTDGSLVVDAGFMPPAAVARLCAGRDVMASMMPGKQGALSGGKYYGVLKRADANTPVGQGTWEVMNINADAPFLVDTIRVAFGSGSGTARIHLTPAFGNSYPATFIPANGLGFDGTYYADEMVDLVPPIDVDVQAAQPDTWYELDVRAAGVVLEPTHHYMLVYEHLDGPPYLAIETLSMGETGRGLLMPPDAITNGGLAYGVPGNYRMELAGRSFCTWSADQRAFKVDVSLPYANIASWRAQVSDLDGDGHDDLVVNDAQGSSAGGGGPKLFLGDGKGGFAAAFGDAASPFVDAPLSTMMVFGDLDNDGDEDAYAVIYLGADNDGDTYTIYNGDCDDTDAAVHPRVNTPETDIDLNCDGKIGDGTDVSDNDHDGFTVKAGDCNDTRADVHPGAAELLDSVDNNCNLQVDETWVHHILRNDGTGHFKLLPDSGVEIRGSTAAAALGDGDGDGNLDIYAGEWLLHYPDDLVEASRYFRGLGGAKFVEAEKASGMVLPTPHPVYGVEWNDFDNDGRQDVYVGNYHQQDNVLWHNFGGGKFADVALAQGVAHDDIPSGLPRYPGGHSYGTAIGDYDNDGDMDYYVCSLSHPRTMPWSDPSTFWVNQGPDGNPAFGFVNQFHEAGFLYDEGDLNAAWGDYDNDGDLDLVVASAYLGHYSRFYRNDGTDGFVDVTYDTGTVTHDAVSPVWLDVNEDGALDLVIASGLHRDPTDHSAPFVYTYVNRGNANHWVAFDLQGTKTNRDGIGARVTLASGALTQMRDVQGSGGHANAQSSRRVHFGLGGSTAIDSLTVRWVGGATETFKGAAADGRYLLVEGTGVAKKR